MNIAKSALVLFMVATVGYAGFHNHDLCQGIVEENDMYISASTLSVNGIDEETFDAILDRVADIYGDVFKEDFNNATLKVDRRWSSGTVNAYASRQGSIWKITMHGGLARHKTITADAFALVACHEVGHHIGGAPKKGTRWATNEGQADYWGNLKCMRKYLAGLDHAKYLSDKEVPQYVVDVCAQQFETEEENLMCHRMSLAGESLAMLFKELRKETVDPKFDTPSEEKVSKTVDSHPKTQCRMDTYFNGGLCTVDHNEDVDQQDPTVASCMNEEEFGSRPLCWFAI